MTRYNDGIGSFGEPVIHTNSDAASPSRSDPSPQTEISEVLLELTSHYALPSITAQDAFSEAEHKLTQLLLRERLDQMKKVKSNKDNVYPAPHPISIFIDAEIARLEAQCDGVTQPKGDK